MLCFEKGGRWRSGKSVVVSIGRDAMPLLRLEMLPLCKIFEDKLQLQRQRSWGLHRSLGLLTLGRLRRIATALYPTIFGGFWAGDGDSNFSLSLHNF
jgi:hypothetical protein